MTHASGCPVLELRDDDDDVDDERTARHPSPFTNSPLRQPCSFLRMWCRAMPAWLMVKLVNTPIGVERDQAVDLRVGDDHQHERRRGEGDDAVREHEPVAALGQLLRHEVVAGVEAGEAREVGEARVRRQHEDQHRAGLQTEEQEVAGGAAAEHGSADL